MNEKTLALSWANVNKRKKATKRMEIKIERRFKERSDEKGSAAAFKSTLCSRYKYDFFHNQWMLLNCCVLLQKFQKNQKASCICRFLIERSKFKKNHRSARINGDSSGFFNTTLEVLEKNLKINAIKTDFLH